MKERLLLASNSPRRRELLQALNVPFEVVPSLFEERDEARSAEETVRRFAEGKAQEVASRYPERLVLGADTVVALDGKILGKPRSKAHAKEMLSALSGKTHSVFTGVCLCGKGIFFSESVETRVTFYSLTEEFIERYVESGSPMDKAGAYGIQDGGLVKEFSGSYDNVVGLPTELVATWLRSVL